MEIRAYNRDYVELAQRNMGDMLDYAVNTLDYSLKEIWYMFIGSGISSQIEIGNSRYIAGMTGCELVDSILKRSGRENLKEHVMYLDKTPEYWCGWAVAYYQWYRNVSFDKIGRAVPIDIIKNMYYTMHEADISRFVTAIDEKMKEFFKETNLRYYRGIRGISQSQLAKESGVSLRMVQMLEQRKRSINRTGFENVLSMAKVLGCRVEELYENIF